MPGCVFFNKALVFLHTLFIGCTIIQEITDTEILEMVAGVDDIQFMVKVPLVDYNDYLAKR